MKRESWTRNTKEAAETLAAKLEKEGRKIVVPVYELNPGVWVFCTLSKGFWL